jgi:hypothetical protein
MYLRPIFRSLRYVGLDQEMSKAFGQGITKLRHMYDALDLPTLKVGPVKDAACPG